MILMGGKTDIKLIVKTDHPIATYSADHIDPAGTMQDNTHHERFVLACEALYPGRRLYHLDLGCAGGGLVFDFISRGHISYGLDGSDYSQIIKRAEWATIPDNLFTADITEPFRFELNSLVASGYQRFDIITAWEVLEHISEKRLLSLLRNLRANLVPGGLFAASVALFVSGHWHITLKPREWWEELFANNGFTLVEGLFEIADFPRGSGNPSCGGDWDVVKNPNMGFHLVCKRKRLTSSTLLSKLIKLNYRG